MKHNVFIKINSDDAAFQDHPDMHILMVADKLRATLESAVAYAAEVITYTGDYEQKFSVRDTNGITFAEGIVTTSRQKKGVD